MANSVTSRQTIGLVHKALWRYGSAFVRYVPINRRKEWLVHKCLDVGAAPPDFTFWCPRLALRWSTRAYPDILTRHLMLEGIYQEDVLEGIRAFVKPGQTVLDVGGHHGLMAIAAARACGRTGCVYTFEPNPASRQLLAFHVELNGNRNIRIESTALGATEGFVKFFVQQGAVSWNSSIFRDFASQHGRDEVAEITVRVTTLDAFVERRRIQPALIKIDAEGSEHLILQGGLRAIDRYRPIVVMEFNPESAAAAQTSVEESAKWFQDRRYSLFTLKRGWDGHFDVNRRKPFDVAAIPGGDLENVFCLPE